jgi:hypothetical protein
MAKNTEVRTRALELRAEGMSVPDIASEVGAAKSTVFGWVKDVEISEEVLRDLRTRGALATNFKKNEKKAFFEDLAREEWPALRQDPEFMFGLALYVGEGRKPKQGNIVGVCNTDPTVMRAALRFFKRLGLGKDRFKVVVQLPNPATVTSTEAEVYWSDELGIGPEGFYPTTLQTIPRKKPADFPFGVCYVQTRDFEVRVKLEVWMKLALEG